MSCNFFENGIECYYCAKRGVSGALNLQSAIARLNALRGSPYGRLREVRRDDNKVLCNRPP